MNGAKLGGIWDDFQRPFFDGEIGVSVHFLSKDYNIIVSRE